MSWTGPVLLFYIFAAHQRRSYAVSLLLGSGLLLSDCEGGTINAHFSATNVLQHGPQLVVPAGQTSVTLPFELTVPAASVNVDQTMGFDVQVSSEVPRPGGNGPVEVVLTGIVVGGEDVVGRIAFPLPPATSPSTNVIVSLRCAAHMDCSQRFTLFLERSASSADLGELEVNWSMNAAALSDAPPDLMSRLLVTF